MDKTLERAARLAALAAIDPRSKGIKVTELAETLGISRPTMTKDLKDLPAVMAAAGELITKYGKTVKLDAKLDTRIYTIEEAAEELGIMYDAVRALALRRGLGERKLVNQHYKMTLTRSDIEALRDRRVGRPARRY